MSAYVSDSVLWLTVIAGSCYAYYKIPDTLNHIRNLAACPEQSGPGPRKQLQKDAENAINIETLRVLSDSHSYDLRTATVKIVASRTVKSRTKRLLLRDLASKDADRRQSAIYALRMLVNHPALHGRQITDHFVDYHTFHALVTALKNMLPDHDPQRESHLPLSTQKLYPDPKMPHSPIRVERTQGELYLMGILHMLLKAARPESLLTDHPDNVACALSAGLVHRWLKHYPFPCALPQNSKYNFNKSDVSNLFEGRWKSDDTTMASIVNKISTTPLGKRHLREAGLRGSNYTEIDDIEDTVRKWRHIPTRLNSVDTDHDVRMTNGEGTAGATTPPPITFDRRGTSTDGRTSRARSQELSREEEILRRRRREAVVVAEAGTPLSQNNILQRTESGSVWRSFDGGSEPSLTVVDDMTEFPSFSLGLSPLDSPNITQGTTADAETNPWSHSSEATTSLEANRHPDPLIQPLPDNQASSSSPQAHSDNRPDSDADDFTDGINGVLERIHQHRDEARGSPNQRHTPDEEERDSNRQLGATPEGSASGEQADVLLSILRQAEHESQDAGADESRPDGWCHD